MKYVAFLRAINVGGHIVTMEQLRTIIGGLGYANVETFIASGNVIFDSAARKSDALEKKIETALRDALGYEVATMIRTIGEVARIANHLSTVTYIGFLSGVPPAAAVRKLAAFNCETDELHVDDREIYWICRTRSMESEISGAVLEKTLGLKATLRNINTVRKIAAKYAR